MYIIIITMLTFILGLWFRWRMKRISASQTHDIEQFFEAEARSNEVRKKEIEPHYFFHADVNRLPVKEYAQIPENKKLIRLQTKALQCAHKKMIHFEKPMSNLEIKNIFGTANLEIVSEYEENFNQFVSSLILWAECLIELNKFEDAEILLKESIAYESEYSKSYTLLFDLYLSEGNQEQAAALKYWIENQFPVHQQALREKILQHIGGSL